MAKLYIRSRKNTGRYKALGFYTVLAFSLLAVGAAAWSATVGIQNIDDGTDRQAAVSDDASLAEADTLLSNQPADVSSEADTEPDESMEPTTQSQEVVEETPDERDKTVATYFILPVSGEVIKKFDSENLQYSETYRDMRLHTGIDIKADLDSRIKSAGNGVVEQVYDDPLTGNTVVINHGNGVEAYYCGLNNIPMVSVGDVVLAGADLGALSTVPDECADAPHLHFAMQKDGVWTSPLAMMNME